MLQVGFLTTAGVQSGPGPGEIQMSKFLRALALAALLGTAASPSEATLNWGRSQALRPDNSRAAMRLSGATLFPIEVDRGALRSSSRSGFLVLPSDGALPTNAQFSRMRQRPDGRAVWIGKVRTQFGTESAILVLGDRSAFGIIPQRRGPPLQVLTLPSGIWVSNGLHESVKAPPLATRTDIALPTPRPASRVTSERGPPRRLTKLATTPTVDITVLYSSGLFAASGTEDAVLTNLALAEEFTNQAFIDSNANARIRIVGAHLIDFPEDVDHDEALSATYGTRFPAVRELAARFREADSADLVAFVRPNRPFFPKGGIAVLNGFHGADFLPENGFSVCGFSSPAEIPFVFAHETGHNLGLTHDFETMGGDYGHFVYSRGHRQALTQTSGFTTLMAYPIAGVTQYVNRFSNPNQNDCLGQPCGIPDVADNVRSLNETASLSAALVSPNPAAPARLILSSATMLEGNSGTSALQFTAYLTKASPVDVSFSATTVANSATEGSDFLASRFEHLVIPAGSSFVNFQVSVVGDALPEQTESFYVHISNAVGASILISRASGIVTDEDLATPQPLVPGAWVGPIAVRTDGPTDLVYSIVVPAGATSVSLETQRGFGDADIYVQNGTIPVLNGFDCAQCLCTSLGPTTSEVCSISRPIAGTYYAIVRTYYVDNLYVRGSHATNSAPQVSVGDLWIDEGGSGLQQAVFYVSVLPSADVPVTFDIASAPGTAQPGVDYTEKRLLAQSLPAGQTTRAFLVNVAGDSVPERNETFTINLDQVSGAQIAKSQAKGVILDDDSISIRVSDATVAEGAPSQTSTMRFEISLSRPSSRAVTFDIGTLPGSAMSSTDYAPTHRMSKLIDAGRTRTSFEVNVSGDSSPEPDETFQVVISNAVGADIADAVGLATIQNDD